MVEPLPATFPMVPRILFTDVDDTLTYRGSLPVEAFEALAELRQAGVSVVPVTGASAGWCDCLIRTWPVETVIGENGALTYMLAENGRLEQHFACDQKTIERHRRHLQELITLVQQEVPEARLTRDTPYRLTDIAFDIGQEQTLPASTVKRILAICRGWGANARASSIHVNVWLGSCSKATAMESLLLRRGISREQVVFIGDSPNDESMFAAVKWSVGVANIQPFLDTLDRLPVYLTTRPGGHGFAELAAAILKACRNR